MYSATTTKVMALTVAVLTASSFVLPVSADTAGKPPSNKFDLSHWNITLPLDADGDDKIDSVSVADIQGYSHPDFFYLNENDEMVFTAVKKAMTTSNSPNIRSELRQMLHLRCLCSKYSSTPSQRRGAAIGLLASSEKSRGYQQLESQS